MLSQRDVVRVRDLALVSAVGRLEVVKVRDLDWVHPAAWLPAARVLVRSLAWMLRELAFRGPLVHRTDPATACTLLVVLLPGVVRVRDLDWVLSAVLVVVVV